MVSEPEAVPVLVTERVTGIVAPGVAVAGTALVKTNFGAAGTHSVTVDDPPPVTVTVSTTGKLPVGQPPPPELPVKVAATWAWMVMTVEVGAIPEDTGLSVATEHTTWPVPALSVQPAGRVASSMLAIE